MNLVSERCFAKLDFTKSFVQYKSLVAQQIRQTLSSPNSDHGKFAKVSSGYTVSMTNSRAEHAMKDDTRCMMV